MFSVISSHSVLADTNSESLFLNTGNKKRVPKFGDLTEALEDYKFYY